jgi:antitoxin HicB
MNDKNEYNYRVILEKAEEGGYVVSVPALPGCHTQGDSFEEAISMAREAIATYIGSLMKDGELIPNDPIMSGAVESVVSVSAPSLV